MSRRHNKQDYEERKISILNRFRELNTGDISLLTSPPEELRLSESNETESIPTNAVLDLYISHQNTTKKHSFTTNWDEPLNKHYGSMTEKEKRQFGEEERKNFRGLIFALACIEQLTLKDLPEACNISGHFAIKHCDKLGNLEYKKTNPTQLKNQIQTSIKEYEKDYQTYFFDPAIRKKIDTLKKSCFWVLGVANFISLGAIAINISALFGSYSPGLIGSATLYAIGGTLLLISLSLGITSACITRDQRKKHPITRPEISILKTADRTTEDTHDSSVPVAVAVAVRDQ